MRPMAAPIAAAEPDQRNVRSFIAGHRTAASGSAAGLFVPSFRSTEGSASWPSYGHRVALASGAGDREPGLPERQVPQSCAGHAKGALRDESTGMKGPRVSWCDCRTAKDAD